MIESQYTSLWENKYTKMYKEVEKFRLPLHFIMLGDQPRSVCEAVRDKDYESLFREGFTNVDQIAMVQINMDMAQGLPEEEIVERVNEIYREDFRRNRITGDIEYGSRFTNFKELMGNYENLYSQFEAAYRRDLAHIRSINETQIDLASIARDLPEHITQSTNEFGTTEVIYYPQRSDPLFNSDIGVDDGLDIFNALAVFSYIPYMRYNEYTKIYDVEEDIAPNLNYIQPGGKQSEGVLYLTVWAGEYIDSLSLKNSLKSNFVIVSYDLRDGSLSVPLSKQNKIERERVVERLTQALKNINIELGEPTSSYYYYHFNIFDVFYDDVTLLDALLTYPTFYTLVYVDESRIPQSDKEEITLHYSPLGSTPESREQDLRESGSKLGIKCRIKLIQLTKNEFVQVGDKIETIPSDTYYVNLYVTKAQSREQAEEFLHVLELLFRLYKTIRQEIFDDYESIGLASSNIKKVRASNTVTQPGKRVQGLKYGISETKGNRLMLEDPVYFSSENSRGYSRNCQCKQEPIPITASEEEDWRNALVMDKKGDYHERSIMVFPPSPRDPTMLLVCPDDENSYPVLTPKTYTSGKDFYPLIPCCNATGKLKGRRNKKTEASGKSKELSTNKVSPVDHSSLLPRGVSLFLDTYLPQYYFSRRYGVPLGPNSLIHCLCTVQDEDYMDMDREGRERYVRNLKKSIFAKCPPGTVKQELYDERDDEIADNLKQLSTSNERVNVDIHYRSLEEYFDVNIFVFQFPPPSIEEELGSIKLPRHSLYHTRSVREDRKTVLIVENGANGAEQLEYNHYEPIVAVSGNKIIARFDENVTEACLRALMGTLEVKCWQPEESEGLEGLKGKGFREEEIPGYYFDIGEQLRKQASRQVIDKFGRTCIVILQDNTVIYTPPIQPLVVENNDEGADRPVERSVAIKHLGQPEYRGHRGLWFRVGSTAMDIDRPGLVYSPISSLSSTDEKLPLKEDPLYIPDYDLLGRSHDMRWQVNTILQVLIWLLSLNDLPVEQFMKQYARVDNKQESYMYYRLSNIPRVLPSELSLEDALSFLEERSNGTLVHGGLIRFYNEEFYQKLTNYLDKYVEENELIDKNKIRGYYRDSSDFMMYDNNTVLVNDEQLELFKSKKESLKHDNIARPGNTLLNPDSINRGDPIIYSFQEDNYIVQGVLNGDLYRALTVSNIWKHEEYNAGFNPQRYPDVTLLTSSNSPKYRVKVLHLGVIPITDEERGESKGIMVLQYSPTPSAPPSYAALLKL